MGYHSPSNSEVPKTYYAFRVVLTRIEIIILVAYLIYNSGTFENDLAEKG